MPEAWFTHVQYVTQLKRLGPVFLYINILNVRGYIPVDRSTRWRYKLLSARTTSEVNLSFLGQLSCVVSCYSAETAASIFDALGCFRLYSHEFNNA